MRPPDIEESTIEERERYIKKTFQCKGVCEDCGFCTIYRGKSPEVVYDDYIAGKRSFYDITSDYR